MKDAPADSHQLRGAGVGTGARGEDDGSADADGDRVDDGATPGLFEEVEMYCAVRFCVEGKTSTPAIRSPGPPDLAEEDTAPPLTARSPARPDAAPPLAKGAAAMEWIGLLTNDK